MTDEYFLTEDGAEKMRLELEDMVVNQRRDLSQRLRFAIQQGDLSENADYHKAKEDQAFLEGKIKEYEEILAGVVIIKKSKSGKINVGSTVVIKEDEFPEEKYQLVGATEASPLDGRISNESPIGKELLGHKAGDEVEVSTPRGTTVYKIISVE
jgi:transcription elongation factor GreA